MPRITYVPKTKWAPHIDAAIETANEIIVEYMRAGYRLTLRQLYYQFVARGLLVNKKQSYDNLGVWISDARLAGRIDWNAIEDRTRNLVLNNHWEDPVDLLNWAAEGYGVDLWINQPERVEVWVEKEALAGVIERPATEWDVAWFCCRGYVSQSEQWRAGRRLAAYREEGQQPTIIHLGDHDPSGVDMTRDNLEKVELFSGGSVNVERIALNMDQIEELSPPPNPVKQTDSRAGGYTENYGDECWELDALDPAYLNNIISEAIERHCDTAKLEDARNDLELDREKLQQLAADWEEDRDA